MSLPVFVQSLHYLQDGLSFPSPGDLPDSEIEPGSPALQVDSLCDILGHNSLPTTDVYLFAYHTLDILKHYICIYSFHI